MSDEELEAMAARLEAAACVEDARFRIVQHGGGGDESHVVANRAGYVCMAALLLNAAVAPHSDEDSDAIELPKNGLMDENSDTLFNWFERHERSEGWTIPDPSSHQGSYKDAFWACGCALLFLLMIGIFVTGLITLFGWVSP